MKFSFKKKENILIWVSTKKCHEWSENHQQMISNTNSVDSKRRDSVEIDKKTNDNLTTASV